MICVLPHIPKDTQSSGSYGKIVWSNAADLLINPELHQSRLKKKFIPKAKSLFLLPVESFCRPVKFINAAFSLVFATVTLLHASKHLK